VVGEDGGVFLGISVTQQGCKTRLPVKRLVLVGSGAGWVVVTSSGALWGAGEGCRRLGKVVSRAAVLKALSASLTTPRLTVTVGLAEGASLVVRVVSLIALGVLGVVPGL
jgi:hypothetical protein